MACNGLGLSCSCGCRKVFLVAMNVTLKDRWPSGKDLATFAIGYVEMIFSEEESWGSVVKSRVKQHKWYIQLEEYN